MTTHNYSIYPILTDFNISISAERNETMGKSRNDFEGKVMKALFGSSNLYLLRLTVLLEEQMYAEKQR